MYREATEQVFALSPLMVKHAHLLAKQYLYRLHRSHGPYQAEILSQTWNSPYSEAESAFRPIGIAAMVLEVELKLDRFACGMRRKSTIGLPA